MNEPRDDEIIGDAPIDDETLRLAGAIAEGKPLDWEAVGARLPADEATGLRYLQRLAAAHREVGREFDAINEPGAGALVSHYRIESRLGSGSGGVVYRARDERLERVVALKLLRPEASADDEMRDVLRREARIAGQLGHPHVATVFDVDEHEGRVFIAMEYVEGKDLGAVIREHPLSPCTAARYGAQIASALEAAHAAGIVHRDLKSTNVIITPAGSVKVLDFGIAVRTPQDGPDAGRADYGPSGGTAGTLAYMAPECLQGEAPDPRCDLWALGVVMYESLTGTRPFAGATRADLERAIRQSDPEPLPRSVPPELRGVVERCLEKNPGRRYQRAGEVRAALEAVRDASRPDRPRINRRSAWVGLLAAALLATALWPGPCPDPPRPRVLIVLPARNAGGDPSQQFLADGLTDDLINSLMKLSAVQVLSHHSSEAIAHEAVPLPRLARRHGIRYAIESSVVPLGDSVRVNVALIDARSDSPVWAGTFQRLVRETPTLDHDIALAVVGALKLHLSDAERAALGPALPVDRTAYEQYVLARNFAAERNYRRALACYDAAIRLNPTFAAAHAGIAQCAIEMIYYGDFAPEATPERARDAALRALAIDSTQARAHLALAFLDGLTLDLPAGRTQLELARADEPGSAEVWYGWSLYYGALGRADEEVDAMERAVKGDPQFIRYRNELGLAYLNARRISDAEAQFREAEQLPPSPESGRARAYRARCLALRGRADEAVAMLQPLRSKEYAAEELGYALARAGRRRESAALLADLSTSSAGHASPLAIAAAQVALGADDAAFATLQTACDHRDSRILWIRVDQRFDPIRKDPRYAALLARLGGV